MKEGNSRGLSTVISTLIIILLVLVAVGIVWAVVRGILSENAEKISFGKLTINLEIVSVKQTPTDLNIKVKRNVGEGDLKGITFIVFDGENSYSFEKTNISLKEFEIKTFVIAYTGKVVSVSIAPMFMTSSGKWITESIADRYYNIESIEGGGSGPVCISNCGGIECGDDGCGGKCGSCLENEQCVQGQCTTSTTPCIPDCSCAATKCIGTTCSDGCEGSCEGLLTPNCNLVMCGNAPNGCGICSECDADSYCDGGICKLNCLISDCGTRECGGIPGRPECGTTICGLCTGAGETCNELGICEVCVSNCPGSSECIPDCSLRECGLDPICQTSCGECNTTAGEYCSIDGQCVKDIAINKGTVFSVWPWPLGRLYFDSPDLPKSGTYIGYYVKVESELDCLTISEFHTPLLPEVYNMTYMKVSATATTIEPGNRYEIWEKYTNCIASSWG